MKIEIYKRIDYFKKFFEGNGVNNNHKEFVDTIVKYLLSCDDIDEPIETNCEEMNMYKMLLIFEKSNTNYGIFDPNVCEYKNDKLYKVKIIIKYTDIKKIHETLYHELNHVNDFYNYIKLSNLNLKVRNYSFINKALKEINIDKSSNLFLYLVYITMDNELNARISQLYSNLILNKSKSEDELIEIIKKSDTYRLFEVIKKYNPEQNLNYLKKQFDNIEIIKMFDLINQTFVRNNLYQNKRFLFIKNTKIQNIDDVESYMRKWKKVFDSKLKKHHKNMFNLLKEIKKDIK